MRIAQLKDFSKGWFIGDFNPSFFKQPFFEIGHHKHKKGEPTFPHVHKVTTELNYIVRGELLASGQKLVAGDMWTYEAGEASDVVFLSDVELIVIRWPSIPSDKYPV